MSDKMNKVSAALTSEGQTLTALAKKAGFSKGSQIAEVVAEMVESGDIVENTEGRFTTYSNGEEGTGNGSSSSSGRPAEVDATKGGAVNLETGKVVKEAKELALPKGYSAKRMKQTGGKSTFLAITTPSGQVFKCEDGTHLLVINGEPLFTVRSPADAFTAAVSYACDKQLKAYTISQLSVGNIANASGVKMLPVITFTVQAHNKAALK